MFDWRCHGVWQQETLSDDQTWQRLGPVSANVHTWKGLAGYRLKPKVPRPWGRVQGLSLQRNFILGYHHAGEALAWCSGPVSMSVLQVGQMTWVSWPQLSPSSAGVLSTFFFFYKLYVEAEDPFEKLVLSFWGPVIQLRFLVFEEKALTHWSISVALCPPLLKGRDSVSTAWNSPCRMGWLAEGLSHPAVSTSLS